MLTILEIGLSLFCVLAILYGVLDVCFGLRQLLILANQKLPSRDCVAELVSVVMVVKDEEKHILETLLCLLKQDYPTLEVIIVDDRSTDKTAAIVKTLMEKNSNVQLVKITKLPQGWLGKNHAMYQGAKVAKGKWLLFLDGDVYFSKNAVSTGMHYLQQHDLNNLTLIPEFKQKSFWLDALITAGALAFYFKLKPWRAKQKNIHFYAGIGTYNLMLRDMYFSFDGHQSFPMCILDDVKLGKQLKKHGAKQCCLDGQGLISINWYETVFEMIKGTEKNSFAHCRFSILTLLSESILGLCLFIWPLISLFLMDSSFKWLNVISIFLTGYLYADYAKMKNLSCWGVSWHLSLVESSIAHQAGRRCLLARYFLST